MDSPKEEVAVAISCNESWHQVELFQFMRDEGYLAQELEWMYMQENQSLSVVTGSGGMGGAEFVSCSG